MPAMLRIDGSIPLEQFWPSGGSDADTTKIQISVEPGAFAYASDGVTFLRTDVFEGADAVGTGRKQVISNNRTITVRLQGVDAAELHYRANALRKSPHVSPKEREEFNRLNAKKRRQYLAETATVALSDFLKDFGETQVLCRFYSAVDAPGDVIDTYGRFVGNILVGAQFEIDLNIWLAQEGWAFPTFYSSMSVAEIEAFLFAIVSGQAKGRLWKNYSRDTSRFEPDLVYRGEGAEIDAQADIGPVIMPKLFRRQLAFVFEKQALIRTGSFKSYLKERRDECFALADFLEQGPHAAEVLTLDTFMTGRRFKLQPHQLVFREKPSTLIGADGKRVTAF